MADKGSRRQRTGGAIIPASTTRGSAIAAPPPAVATTSIEAPPKSRNVADSAAAPRLDVHITLVCGGLTNVKAPIVVGARYDGLGFAGPTKAFDRSLNSWLTRAVDLGIVGSALGQLFPIELAQFHKAGKLNAHTLLLAGMGEPGRLAQDSVRFIFSNIIVMIKTMGENEFASSLLGTRRNELPINEAVRGFVQGIGDGYERIKAIAEQVTEDKEILRTVVAQPLAVTLAHLDAQKLDLIRTELEGLVNDRSFVALKLTITRGEDVPPDPKDEPNPVDVEPDVPITYLRVTRSKSAGAGAVRSKPAVVTRHRKPAGRAAIDPFPTDVFQFSALSDVAVVPQRDQEVNTRLMRDLAGRMTLEFAVEERAKLGTFFTNFVIPDDFRQQVEGPANVTLEVDETTAVYPWEMAGYRRSTGAAFPATIPGTTFSGTNFLAMNVAVSRQFRTLLSPPPTSPPALNNKLNALIIADPATAELALPGARIEGAAVVEVLEQARIAWKGRYEITTTVRIGPQGDEKGQQLLKNLKEKNASVISAAPCDPLELAMLLVSEQFDLVHYAGHGMSDAVTGQTGWVFARDCILSAKEIFRVRQVPRLVFANACFTAVTTDRNEQGQHMAGLAQAFFGRGIPNFIGAGWQVDDDCAAECARWFYARLMGLRSPTASDGVIGTAPPATIGEALKQARNKARERNQRSSSWGAYQHYGHVNDKLVSIANVAAIDATETATTAAAPTIQRDAPPVSPAAGEARMANKGQNPPFAPDKNLVYVNGIDLNTGTYAFAPRSIDDLARQVSARPGVGSFQQLHEDKPRSFALPFGVDFNQLSQSGWGIIFHEQTPQDIRAALQPLMALRRTQAQKRYKELDYKKGEQVRDWYRRWGISPGNVDPEVVPYYFLLIGPPTWIPFEFQYLLGVERAVGRLPFDKAEDYEPYVRSTIAYEGASSAPNVKEIAYWGTRHANDPATNLSASFLINPLANGLPGSVGMLKRAINADIGYGQTLRVGDDATKASLLETLHAPKPPAMLFTASHGMALHSGQDGQADTQGALLCQDWPGFGNLRSEHFLAAADVDNDANVNGLVALLFACFGAGTPDVDQFLMDLSQAGSAPPLAPAPFIAALPRRLLTHPRGSALAVIGHIDRAWGFSMQADKVAEPQIATFRSSIGFILNGAPIGHAVCSQFAARYSMLSVLLLNATSPTTPDSMRLGDRDLVMSWLERNDAQNYILLGDPAARVRSDLLK